MSSTVTNLVTVNGGEKINKKDRLAIIDEVSWVHRDKDGKVINRYDSNNWKNRLLIRLHLKKHCCMVDVGFANVAGLLLHDIGGTDYDYMAIGEGVTAEDHADVEMETQVGIRMGGALCVGTRVTSSGITNNTAQWVSTFSKANDPTLTGFSTDVTEIGIFYDAAGVTVSMLMHQTFAAETMDWDAGDSIEFTVKVQVKQGV